MFHQFLIFLIALTYFWNTFVFISPIAIANPAHFYNMIASASVAIADTQCPMFKNIKNKVKSQFTKIQGSNIHYLETGYPYASPVVLLHGASWDSKTWQEIGTMELLANEGYHVVALDLPGFGGSERIAAASEEFLLYFLKKLNLKSPVIVSPSMSGAYSLPLVANHWNKLRGFVAVAPVGIERFSKQLKGVELPTLAIWGSNDSIVPAIQADLLTELMPNSQKVILPNAGHRSYLGATDEFHHQLIKFIETVSRQKI